MMVEAIMLAQTLLQYMLVFSAQLLLILLIRVRVGRKLGAVSAYHLWLLPLCLLPIYLIEIPQLDWSALQALLEPARQAGSARVSWFSLATISTDAELPELALFNAVAGKSETWWPLLITLWAGVALGLLIVQLFKMNIFSRQLKAVLLPAATLKLRHQTLGKLSCKVLPGLSGPAIYGIVNPCLLLPVDFTVRYSAQQQALMLDHEAVHYQRQDNLWNLLAILVRIIFWFNPLAHLAWRYYRLDQEMSCDEIALQRTGAKEGMQYARTLLESMSGSLNFRHQPTFTAWENLREIKERTNMIKLHLIDKPKTQAGKWLLLTALLTGSLVTVSITGQLQPVVAAEPDSTVNSAGTRNFNAVIEQVIGLRSDKKYTEAKAVLDDLLQKGELDSLNIFSVRMVYANLEQLEQNYEEALKQLQKITASEDFHAYHKGQAFAAAAAIYRSTGNISGSIEALKEAQRVLPRMQANYAVQIAAAYYELQQYSDALGFAIQATELGKNNRANWVMLRALYLRTGDYDQAINVATTMVERFDEEKDDQVLFGLQQGGSETLDMTAKSSMQEILPVITMQPKYPSRAINEKIEGWAQVQFTINTSGEVEGPSVVDSSPEGYFEDSSLAAIAQFKFNPRLNDNEPVAVAGVQYVFRYKLADDTQ